MTGQFCVECRHSVRGSLSVHVWTKAHQAAVRAPIRIRKGERRLRRELVARLVDAEPSTLDDPAPTWKLCRGIPSLEVDSHFEPLESFARNRAYADGFYVRCRSCHRFYHFEYNQRRAARALQLAG